MSGVAVAAGGPAASAVTLLAVMIAEASWLYAVLGYLAGVVGLSVVFGPLSVLFPFSAGCLTTAFVARLGNAMIPGSPLDLSGAARGGSELGWRVRLLRAGLKAILSGVATGVYVTLGVASLLVTVWWELYRDRGLIDLRWIDSMMEDARLSTDFVAPLAWLAIVGAAVWLRGTVLARGDRGFPPVLVRAVVGTSVLLALTLFGPAPQLATPSILVFAVYLLASLAALSSSRLDAVSAEGDVTPPWRWGAALLSISLLVVGLAATVALAWWGAQPIRAAWDAVVAALAPIVVAIAAWLAQLFGHEQPLTSLPPNPPANPADADPSMPFTFPERVREIARWLFNLGWIATMLFAVYATVDRWLTGDRTTPQRGVSRERTGFGWWAFVRRLLAGIVMGLSRLCPPLARMLKRRGLDRRADTVRDLYRRLLGWSAAEGVAIDAGTAPREHRAAMAAAWPQFAAEFDTLTENYLWARFSGLPMRDGDLEASLAGWSRISTSPRKGGRGGSGKPG